MKHFIYSFLTLFILFSCEDEPAQDVYTASEIHTIPYGGNGTLSSGDYSGQGNATNTAGTTVTIDGAVTVDALSASGSVYVPAGSILIVNSVLNVGGGGILDVDGIVITQSFTQVGNTYLSNGLLKVNGKFTIGGGTTLYLENAQVEANELVITGHINAIENSITQAANWFSMIELTGNKYLNRGGGTKVCGPVLFTSNNDQGASGVPLTDVTDAAVAKNNNLKMVYGLPTDAKLYQYDDNCAGLVVMPAH